MVIYSVALHPHEIISTCCDEHTACLIQIIDITIEKDDTEKIRESLIYVIRPQWRSTDVLEKVNQCPGYTPPSGVVAYKISCIVN